MLEGRATAEGVALERLPLRRWCNYVKVKWLEAVAWDDDKGREELVRLLEWPEIAEQENETEAALQMQRSMHALGIELLPLAIQQMPADEPAVEHHVAMPVEGR